MAKEEKDWMERKAEMWKRKEALLDSMSEKELRAFIRGYMMGQRQASKGAHQGCGCGGGGSCNCGQGSCNCASCSGKE